MKDSRLKSYEFIFKDECNFIKEAEVSEVNKGFNLSQLKTLMGKGDLEEKDLLNLTRDDAVALFDEFFWLPLKCDYLPKGVDYFLFDSALVHGTRIASRWLQFALDVEPTGLLTWNTCNLIDERDTQELIVKMEKFRRKFIKNHKDWVTLNSVWTNRITRVRMRAFKMAGLS